MASSAACAGLRRANDEGVVPLLGAIAAGHPIEALARDETLQLPPWLRPNGSISLQGLSF